MKLMKKELWNGILLAAQAGVEAQVEEQVAMQIEGGML